MKATVSDKLALEAAEAVLLEMLRYVEYDLEKGPRSGTKIAELAEALSKLLPFVF